jgi:cobalamin biosynthesis Mg chelatase CobN
VAKSGLPDPAEGLKLQALASVGKQLQYATRYKLILDHLAVLAVKSSNADEAKEAKDILDHINQWATDQLARAKDLEATAPGDAQAIYHTIGIRMAGTQSGAAADARQKDKEFQDNVKAWSIYQRIVAADKSINDVPGAQKSAADPRFAAVNYIYLENMKTLGANLQRTYPKTLAFQEAQKVLAKYSITLRAT